MEKQFRDEWIDDYGEYEQAEAVLFVAKRLGLGAEIVHSVLNARNEFYGALGILTPGEIDGDPTREEVRIKCEGFVLPEDREIDLLVFPKLGEYIEHATELPTATIWRVLIIDAQYQQECTEFVRLNDLIAAGDHYLQ